MALPDLPECLQEPGPYKVMCLCPNWPRPYCYGEFRDYQSAAKRAHDLREATRDWATPSRYWVVYEGGKRSSLSLWWPTRGLCMTVGNPADTGREKSMAVGDRRKSLWENPRGMNNVHKAEMLFCSLRQWSLSPLCALVREAAEAHGIGYAEPEVSVCLAFEYLEDKQDKWKPFLAELAEQGVSFEVIEE